MRRTSLIALLLAAVAAAVAVLEWTDPSARTLERVAAPDHTEHIQAADRQRSEVKQPTRPKAEENARVLEAITTPRVSLGKLRGQVVALPPFEGEVDREGVRVYCWPGWYAVAPPQIGALPELPELQSTLSDADGNFEFDFYVDDAHWIFAITDGACSDPQGMRVGTKPIVEVLMELRPLRSVRILPQLADDKRPLPTLAYQLERSIVDLDRSDHYDWTEFPAAFLFPGDSTWQAELHPNELWSFAWPPREGPLPRELTLHVGFQAFEQLDGTFPLQPVELDRFPDQFPAPLQASAPLSTLRIELSGWPELLEQSNWASEALELRLLDRASARSWTVPLPIRPGARSFDFALAQGSYEVELCGHAGATLDTKQSVQTQAEAVSTLRFELADCEFFVFERETKLTDWRFLTPPRLRIAHRGDAILPNWDQPRQILVLAPLGVGAQLALTGDVFHDGPYAPRRDGQVRMYTAGVDAD